MIDITRPEKAPESLASGRYDGLDVRRALHAAFLGKCYLCETPIGTGTLEIDHRKPKAKDQFPELECEWTNLFPTCRTHGCNGRREKKYPEGGLLDPSAGDDVENRLRQALEAPISGVLNADVRCSFCAVRRDDKAALNTAVELDRIHNGTGSSEKAQETAQDLLSAITEHIANNVAGRVQEFVQLAPNASERRNVLKLELRKYFSRQAPYTMLVRSYFSHRPEIRELFEAP